MKHILWVIISLLQIQIVVAETGQEAWLRYAPLKETARAKYTSLPASVVVLGNSPILDNAQKEIIRGIRSMLGKTLRVEREYPRERA